MVSNKILAKITLHKIVPNIIRPVSLYTLVGDADKIYTGMIIL